MLPKDTHTSGQFQRANLLLERSGMIGIYREKTYSKWNIAEERGVNYNVCTEICHPEENRSTDSRE
jgi:hypothetical protein